MKIDKNTLWRDLAPFLTDKIMAELKEKITDSAFFLDFWNMKCGHFVAVFEGGTPQPIIEVLEKPTLTVFEAVKFLNGFDEFVKDFFEALEKLNIVLSADEIQASKNLIEISATEGILLFNQMFFGLHDFGSAEKITLIEYLIARRKTYNDSLFQRNLAKIQEAKIKKRK